jgi:hypothetical protein
MIHFRSVFLGTLAATLFGWIAILATSHGLLVGMETHRSEGAAQDKLTCKYFTGLAVVPVALPHSPDGAGGRAVCPRLHDFAP